MKFRHMYKSDTFAKHLKCMLLKVTFFIQQIWCSYISIYLSYLTHCSLLEKSVESFTKIFVISKSLRQLHHDCSPFWNSRRRRGFEYPAFHSNLGSTIETSDFMLRRTGAIFILVLWAIFKKSLRSKYVFLNIVF